MRTVPRLLCLALLLSLVSASQAGLLDRLSERKSATATSAESIPTAPGDYRLRLTHDGAERQFRLHIPATYRDGQPTPLVFAFHGGGGNMDIQADDRYYGLTAKSEQAGFIVVFPNGYSRLRGKLATWNAGNCCGAARDKGSDDVGFVRVLLQRLQAGLSIDAGRVFATGMSNGAMMSYRLACEMPGSFRAIAAVAGTDNTRQCAPDKAVSVLHIHARDDELVLFNGGAGRQSDQVTDFVAVPDSMAKWARLNGCRASPEPLFAPPGATCEAWPGCRNGVRVQLCVTETGGHSWPGGQKPRSHGKPPSSALQATDVIWEFFSTQ